MASQKEQFRETGEIFTPASMIFGVPPPQIISDYSVVEVNNYHAYNPEKPDKKEPTQHGVFDPKLGPFEKGAMCPTCGNDRIACPGHFGHIKLALPIFHTGYLPHTYNLLQMICKGCSRVLLDDDVDEKGNVVKNANKINTREYFRKKLDNAKMTYDQKTSLKKVIMALVKKVPKACFHCSEYNGPVKKVGFHKFLHERYKFKNTGAKTSRIQDHPSQTEFKKDMQLALTDPAASKDLKESMKKVVGHTIDACRAQELFENIPKEDYPLLCMAVDSVHPSDLILTQIPVSPSVIRPSVTSDIRQGTNEDDLTASLMHILKINSGLERAILDGKDIAGRTSHVGPSWDVLQSLHALMINSGVNLNAFPSQFRIKDTPRQSLVQRLKGKQGRFRQNLQGKRVNFTARSVISPDPNLRIDQVGIPIDVAKKLTFAEQVTRYNIAQMKNLVKNGGEYPGANEILYKNGEKCNLTFLREKRRRDEKSKELRIGDTVHRHLHDGDIVLFNRQPSLHRQSMMSHQVKVMPWKTFRFNECVCAPYNADFDGDEMNVHLPQTNEARSEAMVLMGVKSNTLTCRSGEPLVASIQDFITSMYLLTQKDVYFTHSEFLRLITTVTARNKGRLRIPQPCILKPTPLWSGKQVFSCLLRPNRNSNELINLSSKAKRFEAPAKNASGKWEWRGRECVGYSKGSPEMICNDSWVLIRNSELVAGTMDKNSLGSGSKKQVFYMLTRDYGEEAAAQAMWRMCRIGPRYLSNRGFSIGIGDVWASENLLKKKMRVIDEQYRKVDEHILAKKHNKLKLQPGCTADETLENVVQKELSKIRDDAAKACFAELSKFNTPLNMALCGSKGSNINIAQMVACVGQQVLSGSRIPNGFEARSLPHFERDSKNPKSRGFVQNSFFSGLTPTEFFFHTMGGREGLVDTAVKTASTGYMQRRLVKALEGLCVQYDGTVRNTDDRVIQFTYGEDQLDPQEMEGDSRPVDFDRVWTDSICRFGRKHDRTICSDEIRDVVREAVEKVKQDKRFKYNDEGFGVGFRNFLDKTTIEFADKQADNVKRHWESYGVYAKSDDERANYQAMRTTAKQVELFVERCALKYFKARMEPGTCVGAICATSIGEPATQMTLKTFHFAGVASMNITQGVPRIEQIINNTQKIKTPIIMAKLTTEDSKEFAQEVASKIEKTTLGEICEYIQEVHNADESFLLLKLDTKRVRLLKMRVTVESIKHSIAISSLKLKLGQIIAHGESILTIHSSFNDDAEWQMSLPNLKDSICAVLVQGLKEINRAVISHQDKKEGFFEMIIDGNDLGGVLATRGIDWKRTSSNHIPKVFEILGIEAARSTIINEMENTMGHHGIHVDRRHLMMLADYMTYTGPVFGCTRIGLANVSNSPLHLSSFEKTSDILYNAAYYGQRDSLAGPSAALILGVPIELGTGLFKLYQETKLDKEKVKKKETLFDHFTQNNVGVTVGT